MKRKIAVFANAWSEKNLSDALEGMKSKASEQDFDLFVFVSHAAPGMSEDEKREEKRIYQLPEIKEFDGVIIFSTTMNFSDLVEDIRNRAVKAKVPVVSIGSKIEGALYVGTNEKESMCELVEHLVKTHGVKDAAFLAGPKDNENSELRIEATKKVFSDNGINFDENEIRYTDWSVRGAMKVTAGLLTDRAGNIPDALICANDTIAMAACAEIEKFGLRIPEDIIVTGHDNVYDGQIFYPALCTVGQDDYELGCKAFEMLMNNINEVEVSDIVIKNHFIRNQSCGCQNDSVDNLRIEECKKRFYEKVKTLEFGWSNNWVSHAALASPNFADAKKNLAEYLGRSLMFGNGTTYILADDNAQLYLEGRQDMEQRVGYSEEFQVVVAIEKHSKVLVESIKRNELIPGYKKIDGEPKVYIFMPAHFQDWVFGYIVVEDWLVGIETGKIKIFLDNFNQTLDKLKQNIALEHLNEKLTDLYTKDSLTGMYNRFGFNSEGYKVFDRCVKNEENMVLMFIDINRMKLINDYYGHLQGDIAIKAVANVIKDNINQDWIAIRFGGDEFLVIGKCNAEEEIVTAGKRISEEVKRVGRESAFDFYLSVSCGHMYFKPEATASLDSYIKQVDEAMYEIKAFMHRSDEQLVEFERKCRSTVIHR